MAKGIRAEFAELQSNDANAATSATAWVLVGTLPHSVRMLLVDNFGNAALQFSVDNNDADYNGNFNLNSQTQGIYDLSSNQQMDQGLWLSSGRKVYMRHLGTAPTGAGKVFIGGIYGKGD